MKSNTMDTVLRLRSRTARARSSITRNGYDWSDRYPGIVRPRRRPSAILLDRRTELSNLLGGDPTSRIQFSEESHRLRDAFFQACADNQLEGVVSELTIAPYRSGRTKTWLKTKCFTELAFVVIGTDRDRKTGAVRALLAPADSDGLSYAGAAFIALRGDERSAFFDQLEQLKTSWAVFKSSRLLDVQWCNSFHAPWLLLVGGSRDPQKRFALKEDVSNVAFTPSAFIATASPTAGAS